MGKSIGKTDLDLLCSQCQQRLSHGHHITNNPGVRADDLSKLSGYVKGTFSIQLTDAGVKIGQGFMCRTRSSTEKPKCLNRLWPPASSLSSKLTPKF